MVNGPQAPFTPSEQAGRACSWYTSGSREQGVKATLWRASGQPKGGSASFLPRATLCTHTSRRIFFIIFSKDVLKANLETKSWQYWFGRRKKGGAGEINTVGGVKLIPTMGKQLNSNGLPPGTVWRNYYCGSDMVWAFFSGFMAGVLVCSMGTLEWW